jgi:hypothetical protein
VVSTAKALPCSWDCLRVPLFSFFILGTLLVSHYPFGKISPIKSRLKLSFSVFSSDFFTAATATLVQDSLCKLVERLPSVWEVPNARKWSGIFDLWHGCMSSLTDSAFGHAGTNNWYWWSLLVQLHNHWRCTLPYITKPLSSRRLTVDKIMTAVNTALHTAHCTALHCALHTIHLLTIHCVTTLHSKCVCTFPGNCKPICL